MGFVEIEGEIGRLVKVGEVGGRDWEGMLEKFRKVGGNLRIEKLKGEIEKVYKMGVGVGR